MVGGYPALHLSLLFPFHCWACFSPPFPFPFLRGLSLIIGTFGFYPERFLNTQDSPFSDTFSVSFVRNRDLSALR